jgi:hypothetical protein
MSETEGVSVPKTMLILKSQPNALTVVETFLRNRGWKIYSTANLKEALVQIVSQKPSYVLISVDHANKKVRALPKLLASAFPVATIVFAENQSSSSYNVLNESSSEYRVYPPVTGPAIERCVNKYLKDQQTKMSVQANGNLRSDNSTHSGNETISIKGGGNDNISIKGDGSEFAGDAASRLLSQFLGEEAGSVRSSTAGKTDSNLIFAQALEDDDRPAGANFIPGPTTGKNDQDDLLPAYLQAKGSNSNQQKEPNGFGQTYVQKGSDGNVGTYVPPVENRGPNYSGTEEGASGSAQQNGNAETPENEGLGSREYRRNSQAAAQWAPMANNEGIQGSRNRRAQSDANQTLIARGAQKSLEESVEVHDGVVKDKLEETTRAACILVESEKFSGYLVAAMGKNCTIDQAFIESIKMKLFKFLKENGEEIRDSDAMDVKVKQVDFEPWALEYADFLRKSVHKGNEVAMAFFPRRPIKAILEDSHHQEMARIQLNELKGDRQVEFDLYVYLPNNNKYVLYTPKGGVFYNKQMDRLKTQGVTHMHVQRDAAAAITKYQAQNYLNDMIEDHEQKQEVLAKSKAS